MLPIAILAGGLAKRLMPITKSLPKALVPVAGRPFIEHQLILLKEQGVKDVVICTGHLGQQIREQVADGRRFGLNILYSEDGNTLRGTGGAIKKALNLLGDNFFVLYGDSYLPINFYKVQKSYLSGNKQALMTIIKNENRWDKSNVHFEEGKILEYDKHNPNSQMLYIDYGLCILNTTAFQDYSNEVTFDLADLYNLLSLKGDLAGFEVEHRFFEIGSSNGLIETEKFLLKKEGK